MLVEVTKPFREDHAALVDNMFESITTLALLPEDMIDYVFKAQDQLNDMRSKNLLSEAEKKRVFADPTLTENIGNILKENLLKGTSAVAGGIIAGVFLGPIAGAVVAAGTFAVSAAAEKSETVRSIETKVSTNLLRGWRQLTSLVSNNELTPEQQAEMSTILKVLPHVMLMDEIASRILTVDQMRLFILQAHGEKWVEAALINVGKQCEPILLLKEKGASTIIEKLNAAHVNYNGLNKRADLRARIAEFNKLTTKFSELKLDSAPQKNHNKKQSLSLIQQELSAFQKYSVELSEYQASLIEIARAIEAGKGLKKEIEEANNANIKEFVSVLKPILLSKELLEIMKQLEEINFLLSEINTETVVDIDKFNFEPVKADAKMIIYTLATSFFTPAQFENDYDQIKEEQKKLKQYLIKLNHFMLSVKQIAAGLKASRFTKEGLVDQVETINNCVVGVLTELSIKVLEKLDYNLPGLNPYLDLGATISYKISGLAHQTLDISNTLNFLVIKKNALVEVLEKKFNEASAILAETKQLAAIPKSLQEKFKNEVMQVFSEASLSKDAELALYQEIHARYIAILKLKELTQDYFLHLNAILSVPGAFKAAAEESKSVTLEDTCEVGYKEKIFLMRFVNNLLKLTDIDSKFSLDKLNDFVKHPRAIQIAETRRKNMFNSLAALGNTLNPVSQLSNVIPNPFGMFSKDNTQAKTEKKPEEKKKPESQKFLESIKDTLNTLNDGPSLDEFEAIEEDTDTKPVIEAAATSSRVRGWFGIGK